MDIIARLFLKALTSRHFILINANQTRLFNDEEHPLVSRRWILKHIYSDAIEQRFSLPKVQTVLLLNRQVTSSVDASHYLTSDERLSCDPNLMPNINDGIGLVVDAINSGQTIAIYGDFDVDGISGAAILSETMTYIGASVITYIPHRVNEGHSLNEKAIEHLNSKNVKLIVTVDCGTTANKEVSFANTLGINVVVTDHHIANEPMPKGVPLVNPGLLESRYPFKHLTGAGVALKFCQALCERYGKKTPSYLYILATLGTIADLGPLVGENRFIVKKGLAMLKETDHVGIKALAQRANCNLKTVTARDLSFTLIPRLNAAGRLDSANISLDILTTRDIGQAESLSDKLEQLNTIRRNLSTKGIKLANDLVENNNLIKDPAFFLYNADWHPGILGLIAGRLSEKYGKPVVAACLDVTNIRASVRGPNGYEVLQGLIDTKINFIKIGGHSQAAGFTIHSSDVDTFKDQFLEAIQNQQVDSPGVDPVEYECEIKLSDINKDNIKFFKSMEPFGRANPQPIFLSRQLNVFEARTVGKTDNHIKLIVEQDSKRFDAIGFGLGSRYHELGNKIDAVFKLTENYWAGNITIQLQIVDFISV